MKSKNEDEGRRMPRSDDISTKKETFERIVKIGDPSSKIIDLAEKQVLNSLMMGYMFSQVISSLPRAYDNQ